MKHRVNNWILHGSVQILIQINNTLLLFAHKKNINAVMLIMILKMKKMVLIKILL